MSRHKDPSKAGAWIFPLFADKFIWFVLVIDRQIKHDVNLDRNYQTSVLFELSQHLRKPRSILHYKFRKFVSAACTCLGPSFKVVLRHCPSKPVEFNFAKEYTGHHKKAQMTLALHFCCVSWRIKLTRVRCIERAIKLNSSVSRDHDGLKLTLSSIEGEGST